MAALKKKDEEVKELRNLLKATQEELEMLKSESLNGNGMYYPKCFVQLIFPFIYNLFIIHFLFFKVTGKLSLMVDHEQDLFLKKLQAFTV